MARIEDYAFLSDTPSGAGQPRGLRQLLDFLESKWPEPDEEIWEVRGPRQQFTHSKVMAWVAFDRAIKLVEDCACSANEHLARWKKIRAQIHGEVCERG